MAKSADVRSIEALRKAKHALAEFRDTARIALSEAFSESQRTLSWIQHEKRGYWQQELRRRGEKVAQAKSDLYRAQLSGGDGHASGREQKMLLKRAEHALEEARMKGECVRRWAQVLDRELMLFRGRCQPISRCVDAELPKGEARLDLLMDRLEAYVRLQAPETGTPRSTGATAPAPDPPDTPEAGAGESEEPS